MADPVLSGSGRGGRVLDLARRNGEADWAPCGGAADVIAVEPVAAMRQDPGRGQLPVRADGRRGLGGGVRWPRPSRWGTPPRRRHRGPGLPLVRHRGGAVRDAPGPPGRRELGLRVEPPRSGRSPPGRPDRDHGTRAGETPSYDSGQWRRALAPFDLFEPAGSSTGLAAAGRCGRGGRPGGLGQFHRRHARGERGRLLDGSGPWRPSYPLL